MPRKYWNQFKFIFLLAAGSGIFLASVFAQPASKRLRADQYRPGRIILIPKAESARELENLHKTQGASVKREYPRLGRIQVVELRRGADTLAAIDAYLASGLIEIAEPDILFSLAATPSDPMFLNGEQWALNNTGQSGGVLDADIDGPEAWGQFTSTSNVIVAVIDSGVRYSHQDLAANMWVNPGEIPGNGLDDDGNGFIDDIHGINAISNAGQPTDDIGHGTHVAGIIGAVGNNGVGTCGVAWQVRIMACRFLNPGQLGNLADLLECLNYAQDKGAKVINCSFTTTSWSSTFSNAFWNLRAAGIVVAAAAGNEGGNNDVTPTYPASFEIDNIVSVTATTRTDGFSGYNYGPASVDLGAPGSSILSTYNRSDADYAYENGTSMASPHVAGALALMRARYPQLSPQQIITRLLATVDPIPSLFGRCTSGGRLNLNRALGSGGYALDSAPFAWIPTNGLTGLSVLALGANDVSGPVSLPFLMEYFGQTYSQVYLSANGVVGFEAAGLSDSLETAIPSAAAPNAALYPYWDDLNPSAGGEIWFGTFGASPHRRFVVSWMGVPHAQTAGGETLFTFQTLLHETGEIVFQYLDVQNGRTTLNSGRSATIGIEDPFGQIAVRYAYHAVPSSINDAQALLFRPARASTVGPRLELENVTADSVSMAVYARPGQVCVVSASPDATVWLPFSTNTIPASGVLNSVWPREGSARFFRARSGE